MFSLLLVKTFSDYSLFLFSTWNGGGGGEGENHVDFPIQHPSVPPPRPPPPPNCEGVRAIDLVYSSGGIGQIQFWNAGDSLGKFKIGKFNSRLLTTAEGRGLARHTEQQ
jgi:hypothetical protein